MFTELLNMFITTQIGIVTFETNLSGLTQRYSVRFRCQYHFSALCCPQWCTYACHRCRVEPQVKNNN